MAYIQKEPLEEVADAIRKLRWSEMMELAAYLASVEWDSPPSATDWAAILHDWSEDTFSTFISRVKEDAKL